MADAIPGLAAGVDPSAYLRAILNGTLPNPASAQMAQAPAIAGPAQAMPPLAQLGPAATSAPSLIPMGKDISPVGGGSSPDNPIAAIAASPAPTPPLDFSRTNLPSLTNPAGMPQNAPHLALPAPNPLMAAIASGAQAPQSAPQDDLQAPTAPPFVPNPARPDVIPTPPQHNTWGDLGAATLAAIIGGAAGGLRGAAGAEGGVIGAQDAARQAAIQQIAARNAANTQRYNDSVTNATAQNKYGEDTYGNQVKQFDVQSQNAERAQAAKDSMQARIDASTTTAERNRMTDARDSIAGLANNDEANKIRRANGIPEAQPYMIDGQEYNPAWHSLGTFATGTQHNDTLASLDNTRSQYLAAQVQNVNAKTGLTLKQGQWYDRVTGAKVAETNARAKLEAAGVPYDEAKTAYQTAITDPTVSRLLAEGDNANAQAGLAGARAAEVPLLGQATIDSTYGTNGAHLRGSGAAGNPAKQLDRDQSNANADSLKLRTWRADHPGQSDPPEYRNQLEIDNAAITADQKAMPSANDIHSIGDVNALPYGGSGLNQPGMRGANRQTTRSQNPPAGKGVNKGSSKPPAGFVIVPNGKGAYVDPSTKTYWYGGQTYKLNR